MKKRTPGVAKPPGATDPTPESMDTAQPDERDETPERDRVVDYRAIGPRMIIEQAGRDIAHGLEDSDLHGTPTNVPGPRQHPDPSAEVPADGGNRRSYSEAQGRKPGAGDATPTSATGARTHAGKR